MKERPARTRSGRKAGRKTAAAAGLAQPPWQTVVNPYPPLAMLSEDALEAIHETSLRILVEIGIELSNSRAQALFANAGAEVDQATGIVRIGRELVDRALATAPSLVTVTPRNPGRAVTLGGNQMAFGLVAGPPNVHDRVRGRRAGNHADYCDLIRLAQVFNVIHLIGNQVVAPVDMPANTRHLDTYDANLKLSDMTFHALAIGRGRALDAITMMALSRGMTAEEMRGDPGILTIISVNSPRKIDDAMAEGLMVMAEYGQAVCVTPFTLMGAMTPVTLAAGLAQQNAEALFGVVFTQLVNPGAPVIYGSYTSNVDMRTGAPAFGTPENAKANVISGQLARRYGLPYRCSPTNASNTADTQAVWETQMALWGAVMGHGNLIYHAAGWLEGGLTASYEKLVLDVEMIQHMIAFLDAPKIDAAELGFEAIRGVPPGGHFFGEPHTLERYETAFYQPILSDWQNHENWQIAGAKTAEERATAVWQQALKEYRKPPMAPERREALDAYIAKRREEIGTGEP
ncbi:MAG: trimethylamine methyltransferase family protein [Pseudomonadota bacterium]